MNGVEHLLLVYPFLIAIVLPTVLFVLFAVVADAAELLRRYDDSEIFGFRDDYGRDDQTNEAPTFKRAA
jgi:hypothetical protein